MPKINIALLNGHAELPTLPPSSTVQDVRTKHNRPLGKSTSNSSLPQSAIFFWGMCYHVLLHSI